jgi:hypothetical protein
VPADAVVFNLDGETVVCTAYPDGNPQCAGVFRRVADGL